MSKLHYDEINITRVHRGHTSSSHIGPLTVISGSSMQSDITINTFPYGEPNDIITKFPQLVDTHMSWWSLLLQAACSQQVVPAVDTIGRLSNGLITETLCPPVTPVLAPLHDSISMHKIDSNWKEAARLWWLPWEDGGGGQERWPMFTQSRQTIVHDNRSLRFRVHEEHKSASLLIPSAGRDKLSPLMKSFHRLHAVGGRARPCGLYTHWH